MGINPAYENVRNVSISRLNYDGTKEDILIYNISDNPEINRGDRIRIIADETQKRDFKVFVDGEIMRPGNVPITKNNTTIREVLLKVGGLKPTADLNRAEIIRGTNVFRSVIFSEEFETMMMNRMSNITKDDSLTFAIDNQLRFSRGNGIIDFNRVLDSTSRDSKFIVKDGDYIFIPEKLNLVYVFGQVNNPAYVEYVQGKDWSYYIDRSGGVGETAKDEIYLIKGESRSWISLKKDKSQNIEPGDYIWIPKKIPRTFDYYMNRIMTISSVVGTIATLILIIIQAGK
jgi:protein involved in polysaccharide export with SLBB domain